MGAASRAHAQPVRLIAGVNIEGGGFVGRTEGALGGIGVHAGIHLYGFEVYGLSQGLLGSVTAGPHRAALQGVSWNSVMLGFGAGPFHLAVGPSLDFAWGCSEQTGDGSCYRGDGLFGLDGRVAVELDHFAISVDVHPTFYQSSAVLGVVFGLGWAY